MSNMWAEYAHIQNINNGIYMQAQVNHTPFCQPQQSRRPHTKCRKHVDACKEEIKSQFGTSLDLFRSYLEEFIFHNAENQNVSMFADSFLHYRRTTHESIYFFL